MYPNLYAKAQATISNMSKANYFYIISYPEYGGYKIVHDPVFTAYIAIPRATNTSTTSPTSQTSSGFIIAIVVVVAIIIAAFAVITIKRKNKH